MDKLIEWIIETEARVWCAIIILWVLFFSLAGVLLHYAVMLSEYWLGIE